MYMVLQIRNMSSNCWRSRYTGINFCNFCRSHYAYYLLVCLALKATIYFSFKANMTSDIPLENAAISFFLANFYLKQGISSKNVMVDFVCIGLLDLWGARTENYKMKNSCQQWDSSPRPSAYEVKSLYALLLNVERSLPDCAIKIYLYSVPVVYHCSCKLYTHLTF